jgi:ankyrin repeat protein
VSPPACSVYAIVLVADINCKQGQDEVTPLHLACRYNSRTATQFLLSRAAATHVMNYVINMKDVKGRTPLHYATRRGHEMVIKVLMQCARGLSVEGLCSADHLEFLN